MDLNVFVVERTYHHQNSTFSLSLFQHNIYCFVLNQHQAAAKKQTELIAFKHQLCLNLIHTAFQRQKQEFSSRSIFIRQSPQLLSRTPVLCDHALTPSEYPHEKSCCFSSHGLCRVNVSNNDKLLPHMDCASFLLIRELLGCAAVLEQRH